MGRFMTLKPKGNQSVTMSKAEINEFNRKIKQAEQELIDETTDITILLVLAYLMDEPEFDYSAEKMADFYERINNWAENINDHLISVQTVIDLIKDKTELEIKWRN